MLLFLGGTFCLNDFVRVAKNKRIYSAASDWNLKLTRSVILDFFSHNWSAGFRVLFDPVKNLLFTMLLNSSMLPSRSRCIQPMLECRFDTISWAFDLNALANALIDSEILGCDSAISRTDAICWNRNSIFEKSGLFGGCHRRLLGYKLRRRVARGFQVVARALRPFGATLSHIESNGWIPRQFFFVGCPLFRTWPLFDAVESGSGGVHSSNLNNSATISPSDERKFQRKRYKARQSFDKRVGTDSLERYCN
jgi:hypothetical protein